MDIFLIFPIVISIVAVAIAYYSFVDNRQLLKWSTSYTRLREAESLIKDNPELLDLYSVDENLLKRCNTNAQEIAYMLSILRTMQELYRFQKNAGLSPYLKKIFESQKVVLIWEEIIFNRFVFRTKFVDDLNNYVREGTLQKDTNYE
ncbi:hypothetical protein [Desulfosarcina ovata]|uniref:Uncharacterized protein n=1 Tax=Desulfosarcina ovata subsp. ovata TaxID=2752305 RepID=A0A5K8AH07_9BACT|nr:hypothetical protein [Desulfosarcina ovata]BBO91973.1 hypothetical protein DSCOOX_51530 [Desulfosarcina ovata subsp. ovata]